MLMFDTALDRRVPDKRAKDDALPLSPAQEAAYARLTEAIQCSPIVLLQGEPGSGKTTLVERLIRQVGGLRIDGRDVTLATANSAHPAIEEQFHGLIEDALRENDLVVLEDCQSIISMTVWSGGYQRPGFINTALRALGDAAREAGKHIVLTGDSFWFTPEYPLAPALSPRAFSVEMPPLDGRDFEFFLRLEAGAVAGKLDAQRIYQYSPSLNVYHLRQLSRLAEEYGSADEEFAREMIDTRILKTNMRLSEVEHLSFADLKGFESLVDRLTTFVINPLKADARFAGLGLKPKRGVLLYGPPGTGKTSIGRALAHQMKGKFFMIDGTIPPEPAGNFFARIKQVFESAKSATPSVIFIDDADVLFQSDRSTSLNRYLLTMLDGLESETAGKVAVIMTAMDPNHMPQALLRSGRVELWLETKPPAAGTRGEIIAAHAATLPQILQNYDIERITELTDGFNAADMRRIVADVKALYAADVMDGLKGDDVNAYFETAARNVRHNKDLLALAEGGRFDFSAPVVETKPSVAAAKPAAERSEAEKKKSRLRDEMNSCEGE